MKCFINFLYHNHLVEGSNPSRSPFISLLNMSRSIKRPYRKSRRFDKTCRNHGACSYCRNNRLYSSNKKLIAIKDEEKEEE